jgi:hypothetical protein
MENISYTELWEKNKERILEQDRIRHEMNIKWAVKRIKSDKTDPKITFEKFLNNN